MKNIYTVVAMILALLVVPVTFAQSMMADMPRVAAMPRNFVPTMMVAQNMQAQLAPSVTVDVDQEIDVQQSAEESGAILEASEPTEVTVAAVAEPVELTDFSSDEQTVESAELAEPQQVQSEDQELKVLQEKIRKLREAELEKVRKAAEVKAAQEVKNNLDQMPRLFGQLPVDSDTEQEINGISVETSTKYGKFEIFAKKNGESKLPRAIMQLGIQQAVNSPKGEEFTRRYKAATTRLEQENILREFDHDVANYHVPEQLVDPESVVCYSNQLPSYFPKDYHVIHHFGSNPETRMAGEVNTFEDFVKAAPKAIEAIRARLPGFITDFRVRAELADDIYQMVRTGKIDSKVAKEDWTRNYKARDWSTGSRTPLHFVWFEPDEIGMQERGLLIISRISGEAFWLNYRCGINIDKVSGCSAPVFVGTFKVNVDENYQICDRLEIPGKQVIGKDKSGNNLYALEPQETVVAQAIPRSTGPDVRGAAGWIWQVNNRPYDHEGMSQVPVNGSLMVNHSLTLTVSSSLPKKEQTEANERKFCSVSFTNAPKAFCETLGQMYIRGERVYVPFRFEDESHLVKHVVYLLDRQAIPQDQVRQEQTGISFAVALISAPGDHHVNVQLLGDSSLVLDECKGESRNNLVPPYTPPPPPPAQCKCDSPKHDQQKFKRTDIDRQVTVTPKFSGDFRTIKTAIWTDQNGEVVDKKFVGDNLSLTFRAGQLLPTEVHKHQPRLKSAKTTFRLVVVSLDGTETICQVTVNVSGGSILPWVILAAVVIAVIIIIVVTHGGAIPALVSKPPIPVIGV